jgi:glycerol-3-phosphate acyltransferase PlsY
VELAKLVLLSYLIGAVPCGLLLARLVAGVDVREHGSGNIGATNVLRVCGPALGLPALLLDALKGFAPVFWLVPALAPGAVLTGGALAALATVVGHTFPVYLGFRGGKGVATSAGALLALIPAATGLAVLAFLLVLGATRYVSVGSTAGAVTIVAAHHALSPSPYGDALPVTLLVWLVALLVVVRHRSNYVRLWQGTENRLGRRAAPPTDEDLPPAPEVR